MAKPFAKPPTRILPSDFGFDPQRLPEFRPGQLEAALNIASSDKRFSCLSAATGTGKSACNLMVGLVNGWRTLVLTVTKNLQTQYAKDTATLNAADIRGQANYRCIALDRGGALEGYGPIGSTCDQGPCKAGVFCWLKDDGCLHYDKVREAQQRQIVVGNYAYWLALARYGDPTTIGQFDLLVLDEAHAAEMELVKFCAVELDRNEVATLLKLKLPPIDEGIDVWVNWARDAAIVARRQVIQKREQLKSHMGDRRQLTKELLRLTSLERGLEEMSRARSWKRTDSPAKSVQVAGEATDWIAYETDKGARFSPVWGAAYAESLLFRGIKKVVLSSGTLLPSVKRRLGIDDSMCDWHEVASSFDPKRRPVIYSPATRMDNKATEGQKRIWLNHIDRLLMARMDRKVLIHSVSYERANDIARRLKQKRPKEYASCLITHNSYNKQEAIERFRRSRPPCVLISPAMVEGVNFPYDELRCQILPKVPFASVADPVFKARCKQDPSYRFECAALLITQMCGRGMRADDDACESIITDGHFAYLRWKTEWSDWFKAAWRESADPKPLELN